VSFLPFSPSNYAKSPLRVLTVGVAPEIGAVINPVYLSPANINPCHLLASKWKFAVWEVPVDCLKDWSVTHVFLVVLRKESRPTA
jgi:hypothetical protein